MDNSRIVHLKNIIQAGLPKGLILGLLLFLIYINDLSDDLTTNIKLFADDTSPFFVVHDVNTSPNNDLSKINGWEIQWKISFDSNPSKKAQEVIFSIQKTLESKS